jgi:hypothetical protein
MESKRLIYKNGHFYDQESKKRIKLADGANIVVTTLSEYFMRFTPVGTYPLQVLNSEEKKNKVVNEFNLSKYQKIFDKDSFLYFSIHRYTDKKRIAIHEFQVELLEDLYLFLKKDWKLQEERLYDCACVVRKNTTGSIDFFEEVNAESLNEVYKYTFVHYFGNEGNPACNAIDRFYDQPGNEISTLRRFRSK